MRGRRSSSSSSTPIHSCSTSPTARSISDRRATPAPARRQHHSLAPVHLRRAGTSAAFERFLTEIFDGDVDLVRYMQRAIGYSLTGDTSEQVFHICPATAPTARRPSSSCSGRCSASLQRPTLTPPASPPPPARAACARPRAPARRPARTAAEIDTDAHLAESLVKQLTGGEAITSAQAHQKRVRVPAPTQALARRQRPPARHQHQPRNVAAHPRHPLRRHLPHPRPSSPPPCATNCPASSHGRSAAPLLADSRPRHLQRRPAGDRPLPPQPGPHRNVRQRALQPRRRPRARQPRATRRLHRMGGEKPTTRAAAVRLA